MKGWRQHDLAKEVGVTYFTVSAWELGQQEPTDESLDGLTQLGGRFKALAAEARAPAARTGGPRHDQAIRDLWVTVARLTDAVEALERRVAALENPPGHTGRQVQ